tara:strand:+ start:1757 stop:2278 length:522 start_codon:yes stop_codon:yes gene_type:complete
LRNSIIFLLFFFYSFSLQANDIATIKLSFILDKSKHFKEFLSDLEIKTKPFRKNLKIIEDQIVEKQKDLEDSRLLLSEDEINNQLKIINNETLEFKNSIDNFNNKIDSVIESNREVIIKEIFSIVKEISVNSNINIVLNENQYFLVSDKYDISNEVLDILNTKNIELTKITIE